MIHVLWAALQRDLTIALQQRGELANPLIFFMLVLIMLAMSVGPDPQILTTLAPGLLWMLALLATLLSLDSLFRTDLEDGSLEQMLLSGQPLYALVLIRVLTYWLCTGLPLALLAPLLGTMLALPSAAYWPLLLSLLLGTASLSLIGAIGAALMVSLKRGGLLLSLLIMPLYVPVLIFGSGSVRLALEGYSYQAQLAILGAFLSTALVLAPFAIAGALRISLDS